MIGTIDVTVQAARPDLPLPPVRAFVGSPSSVRVRNVPRRIGEWDITRVLVTANYPDSTTEMAECVLTGGVWVGTVRGCSTPGTSLSGFVVTADGVDEHGSTVSGYILGVGDVIVLTREESVTTGVITFKGDKGDKGDPGEVNSVNGKVGAVSLGANDVGAYTKDETDAALAGKLDKTAVVAPSASATAGQAADAKAVNDALSVKVDNVFGKIKTLLMVGPEDNHTVIAGGEVNHGYKDGEGIELATIKLPQKSGNFALVSDIEDAVKGKVGSFESVGGASATVENGVAKLSDFFTESNSLLTGTIDARLPYPLYAVPSTGMLKDRALNTTSLASVTVPDNFTDLLIRASVASSLSVTMPGAIATKYGDAFPGEAGEYLITITKTGAAEAYVRTIKLEVANA